MPMFPICFPVSAVSLTERLPDMPKLTPQAVSALTLPEDKTDALYFDEDVPGLALRLRAGGSKTWTFQYRIGTRQRRLNIGAASALTPHEARKRAALLHAKVKLGQDPADEKTKAQARAHETFGVKLPLFLARRARLRPRAFVEVERHLTVHAKRLHHLPLAGVARRDVAGVLTTVTDKLSGASANRVRSSLSAFFSWSIREGLLDTNPAAWTERREEAARDRLLTDDELRDIWMALSDDTYTDIVRLLVLTGARREEIGGLKWLEIDPDRGLITLPPSEPRTTGRMRLYSTSPRSPFWKRVCGSHGPTEALVILCSAVGREAFPVGSNTRRLLTSVSRPRVRRGQRRTC